MRMCVCCNITAGCRYQSTLLRRPRCYKSYERTAQSGLKMRQKSRQFTDNSKKTVILIQSAAPSSAWVSCSAWCQHYLSVEFFKFLINEISHWNVKVLNIKAQIHFISHYKAGLTSWVCLHMRFFPQTQGKRWNREMESINVRVHWPCLLLLLSATARINSQWPSTASTVL